MQFKPNQRAIYATLLLTAFVTTFTASATNLAIPEIALEFRSSATLTGWIVTGYILVTAMLAVPFGRFADATGRRRVYIVGCALFIVFSALIPLSQSIGMMLALRVVVGVSGAMIFATNTAILVGVAPPNRRGRMLGLSVMCTYIGLTIGPVMGGILTHNLGWRSIFIVTALIGLVSLIVAVIGMPKRGEDSVPIRKIRFSALNPLGSSLYAVGIFALMFGFSEAAETRLGYLMIGVGAVLLVIFVKRETVTKNPIIKVKLFTNLNFLFSNIASLLNYGATFALSYMLSIYLQIVMGYNAQTAGLILVLQPALQAVFSPIAGRLSDKHSPFKLASLGMGLCAAGLFSYIFVGVDSPLWHVMINLAVVGIGFGFFSSPNTNAIMSSVPPQDSSIASSMIATMRSLGHTSSMAVITLITHSHLGNAEYKDAASADIVAAMHTAFIIFAVICAVGIFISLQRKTRNEQSGV
ncbi:MAG: MFS transporter [Clostridiales Family XIII bacterium]|jgi:EmrB/QacA subfamily drug resistance transporter|nr:MFS transporter [Clostridiales Family XIII bacterium]